MLTQRDAEQSPFERVRDHTRSKVSTLFPVQRHQELH